MFAILIFDRIPVFLCLLLVLALSPIFPVSAQDRTGGELIPKLEKRIQDGINDLSDKLKKQTSRIKKQLNLFDRATYPVEYRTAKKRQSHDYQTEIRPILERKCVACHGCYDAPCQLKLGSGDGLMRGASKIPVYDATRLSDAPPTRLGIDGQSIADWRRQSFFPVLPAAPTTEPKSLFQKMIDLGRSAPHSADRPIPDDVDLGFDRNNVCPAPSEFSAYAEEHPRGGMPFAVSGLSDAEYSKLSTWLSEGGAVGLPSAALEGTESEIIDAAESWLNRPNDRSRLVARYV
jgi:hypothetical protein